MARITSITVDDGSGLRGDDIFAGDPLCIIIKRQGETLVFNVTKVVAVVHTEQVVSKVNAHYDPVRTTTYKMRE